MSGSATPHYAEWSEVALSPDFALIARAVDALRDALAGRGATAGAIESVRLGVTEALTNAIRHGACASSAAEVRLRWSWADAWLVVEVSEPGEFAPPASWLELPEDPLCESGRGGFLIAQQFEEIEHRNAHGRHTLRLRKKLGPPRAAAAVVAELEQTLGAMTEDLSASYETLAALFRLAETLATAADFEAFLHEALRLRSLIEADAIHVRLRDPRGQLTLLARAGDPLDAPETLSPGADTIEAEVFRRGLERTLHDPRALGASDPLRAAGVVFVCPIHFQGRQFGVCVLARRRAGAFFTAAQLSLARATAEFVGIACANAELQAQRIAQLRAQRELEIAAQIQRSLIPSAFPLRTDWRIHGICENAEEAGGDFFDVLEVDDGVLLVIADVMGKGVPAALLAVVLRTAVRAHAIHAAKPDQLLNCVSAQIAPDLERLEMFITALAVFLPSAATEIVYANAGHCPPLIIGRGPEENRQLDEGGLPLGVAQEERYSAGRGTVQRGERLLLVTDGILEATDTGGRELGAAGLFELARQTHELALAAANEQLLARVQKRNAGRALVDDRTLLAIEKIA